MRTAIFSILLAVLAIFLLSGAGEAPAPETADTPEPGYSFMPAPDTARESAPPESITDGDQRTMTVFLNGENVDMPVRTYLIGVLAAEMPADYQLEALKAQAVAARTYALYKAGRGAPKAHPEAPVCGDASCCAAYQAPEALLEKWGQDFYERLRKIEAAVDGTAGLYLSWEGQPILAVFHAASGGMTESCAAVWGSELPYLVSVSSPETDTESTVRIAWSEFLETMQAACPEAVFGENRADWVSVAERTESGRVATVKVGGVLISGMDFRFLFELRSTDFQIAAQEDGLLITVQGYGHGVGMSQRGAEAMAAGGEDFQAILAHYYPGCTLESAD